MEESGTQGLPSFLDASRMSLTELRTLDDRLIGDLLGVFLQNSTGIGSRRWDDGGGDPQKSTPQP